MAEPVAAAEMTRPRVGLFVTCLVDLISPSVGFAAVKLLEGAGCSVDVPAQSCCGQPAYNSGDRDTARALAQMKELVKEPILHRVEYADGLKSTMLLLNGLVKDFTFAAQLKVSTGQFDDIDGFADALLCVERLIERHQVLLRS